MGIQYDTKLIIGFELDSDSVQKWISENQVEDHYLFNKKLREKYPEIPDQTRKPGLIVSTNLSVYVIKCTEYYESDPQYYLSFYEHGYCTIKQINEITTEHLNLAKKVYKEITNKELECNNMSDIRIFSALDVN